MPPAPRSRRSTATPPRNELLAQLAVNVARIITDRTRQMTQELGHKLCTSQSAFDHFAAIRVQDLAGHVGRILTGKEQVARRHLIWLARASERHVLSKLGHAFRIEACGNKRRPDRSRSYRIEPNY